MTYFDFSPWNTVLNEVRAAEANLGNPAIVWYRGVSSETHDLVPSLLRRPNGLLKEKELFTKYRMLASKVHDTRNSDWQYLFDMQHYRIPTRLLDWTEVLGIAVFFAMLGSNSGNAAVYVLDPISLNKKSSKSDIPLVDEDKDFDYKTIYWDHLPMPPIFPLAIEAPAQNNRILAQRGKFTVHGVDENPVNDQFPDAVRKVVIPVYAKESAREFLSISGINEFSVFPDVVGLAPFLETIVGIE